MDYWFISPVATANILCYAQLVDEVGMKYDQDLDLFTTSDGKLSFKREEKLYILQSPSELSVNSVSKEKVDDVKKIESRLDFVSEGL